MCERDRHDRQAGVSYYLLLSALTLSTGPVSVRLTPARTFSSKGMRSCAAWSRVRQGAHVCHGCHPMSVQKMGRLVLCLGLVIGKSHED